MKSITSYFSQSVAKVKLAYSHEGECAGIEYSVTDAHDNVIQDSGNETEKHEGNCKCDHDYWFLRINDYVLKLSMFIQR